MTEKTPDGPPGQSAWRAFLAELGKWFRRKAVPISVIGAAASIVGILLTVLIFLVQGWRSDVRALRGLIDQCKEEQRAASEAFEEEWTKRVAEVEQASKEHREQLEERVDSAIGELETRGVDQADLQTMEARINNWIEGTLVRNICDALPNGRYNFRDTTCTHSGDKELWISPVFRRD